MELAGDDEGLKEVVEAAYGMLGDPIVRKACVGCVEAVEQQRRKKKRDSDDEDALLEKFVELIARYNTTRERRCADKSEYSVVRAEKKKERRRALKTLQEKQLQDKQDIILFDIATTARSRRSLERYECMDGDDSSTEPRTPSDDMDDVFTTEALDMSLGVGGLSSYRLSVTSFITGGQYYDHHLSNVMRRSLKGGRQPLPQPDEAALALLEKHGFLTLTNETPAEGGGVTTVTPLIASRKHLSETIEVKTGCVGDVIPWLVPVCVATQTRAHITLKGPTDAGSTPVSAYQDGYCQMLSLFSCDAEVTVAKRKGNHQNTAVLKVNPTVFMTPAELVEPGEVTDLNISVWVSKGVPLDVGRQVAQAALTVLSSEIGDAIADVVPKMSLWKEDGVAASVIFISVQMRSANGGVWYGWSLGGKGTKASQTGERAALQLVKDYTRGGLIPDYLQDHAALMMASCQAPCTSRILINTPTPALHTAIALLSRTHEKVSFQFVNPILKGRNKRSTILQCTVVA
eukprot:TRINITY_DN13541_c0_g1_i1.p1 TRINITY_DN13541_c0_g1~~TRINITY_DN13541_c0_g1_i1.p1  ORF type:complete len:576 (+),score=127.28 TRINITY_DN13541_c0_g1_i1:183-1730(+)